MELLGLDDPQFPWAAVWLMRDAVKGTLRFGTTAPLELLGKFDESNLPAALPTGGRGGQSNAPAVPDGKW